jgi:hypothetical protein
VVEDMMRLRLKPMDQMYDRHGNVVVDSSTGLPQIVTEEIDILIEEEVAARTIAYIEQMRKYPSISKPPIPLDDSIAKLLRQQEEEKQELIKKEQERKKQQSAEFEKNKHKEK